ncbi:MAG TPA: hypothetical protein PKD72_05190, partial [Gemmatales bacterium]|nr:hypothetical protein [Gemmatales bacterium]
MNNGWENYLRTRLQPVYLKLAAGSILCMGVVLGTLCFITHDGGTSAVGIPFGADFAGFYVSAQ